MKRLIWIFRAAFYMYRVTGGGDPGRKLFWMKECWGAAETLHDNFDGDEDRDDPIGAMAEEMTYWGD
ncbi:hypothetical protein [Pseudomonas veronii]